MYRHIPLLAALVMAASADAAIVSINFDEFSNLDVLKSQYSAQGVTFSAWEGGSEVSMMISTWGGGSPALSNLFNGDFLNRADIIRMSFTSPVSQLQWMTDSIGREVPTFNAYDVNGNLLEKVVALSTNLGNFLPTVFSASGISYVEGIQPTNDWHYLIDDLSFSTQDNHEVPEPGSLALVGLGIASLAAVRRKMPVWRQPKA